MSGIFPVDVLAENPLLHYSTIISYPGGVRKCRLLVKLVGIVMIRLVCEFTVLIVGHCGQTEKNSSLQVILHGFLQVTVAERNSY